MAIVFERLIGRDMARFISAELDLAGVKTTVNDFIMIAIVGFFAITVVASFALSILLSLSPGVALIVGITLGVIYEVLLYAVLEFKIDERVNFVELVLPDYLQLTAANMRSGVSMSKAMTMATRPEFKYFGDDITILGRQLYSGETMQSVLAQLASRYRSLTLKRTLRVIGEAQQYGGGMADLLNQISKDLRNQHIVQKEVSGQLFMYTIFIAFAALVGAPALYGLTNEMIKVTSSIWSKISLTSLSNLPSIGTSFVKLSAPQITPDAYYYFSIAAIVVISGFGAFIIATISTGAPFRGLKYLPVFIVIGIIVFFVVSTGIGGLFSSIQTT